MDESSPRGDEPVLVETTCDGDIPSSATVVAAVAAADNSPMEELPPLGNSVDTQALDDLVAQRSTAGRVSFEYCGYLVTVRADRVIRVHETESDGC